MSIYNKLLNIQKKIVALAKDKKSYQYDYVTGNKLLGYIKPIMNEESVLLKQEIIKVEHEKMTYNDKRGNEKNEVLYLCEFKFTWIDCETGEKDENLFQASGMNDWEKGMGSAMTYAERYFILKYFHIATDEDDVDNENRKKPVTNQAETKAPQKANKAYARPIQPNQLQRANILISELGIDTKVPEQKEKMYKWLGITSLKSITENQAAAIINKLIAAKKIKKEGK